MSARREAPRHQSRRAALQVLYAVDLASGACAGAPPSADEVFEGVAAHFDLHGGAHHFARQLAKGVEAHRGEIDARIAACARNWRIERMAAVDRNVLRLASYELMHTETPYTVVIDEAVELAREFGSEPSPGFVNGVLDAVARSIREEREDGEGSEA